MDQVIGLSIGQLKIRMQRVVPGQDNSRERAGYTQTDWLTSIYMTAAMSMRFLEANQAQLDKPLNACWKQVLLDTYTKIR